MLIAILPPSGYRAWEYCRFIKDGSHSNALYDKGMAISFPEWQQFYLSALKVYANTAPKKPFFTKKTPKLPHIKMNGSLVTIVFLLSRS